MYLHSTSVLMFPFQRVLALFFPSLDPPEVFFYHSFVAFVQSALLPSTPEFLSSFVFPFLFWFPATLHIQSWLFFLTYRPCSPELSSIKYAYIS